MSVADRGDSAFWRHRHSAEPLSGQGDETINARFLVPLQLVDAVVRAGGRCIHPSVRTILSDETADATGFTSDIAVVEAGAKYGRIAGIEVVAASYRWEGVRQRRVLCERGAQDVYMPSNNEWFVSYLCRNGVLGWLDYVAHDFSDPAVLPQVIDQMGAIYSSFTVVAQYLLDPRKTSAAMQRGWIFQESAFTNIHVDVMQLYVNTMQHVSDWLFGERDGPQMARCDSGSGDRDWDLDTASQPQYAASMSSWEMELAHGHDDSERDDLDVASPSGLDVTSTAPPD